MKRIGRVIPLIAFLMIILAGCSSSSASAKIFDLTVNYKTNPIGIEGIPCFSWKMEDDKQGQKQTAYQIQVFYTKHGEEKSQYVWDSGKVESGVSVAIPYEGEKLLPETIYCWKVDVWNQDGIRITSERATFETGKMDTEWEGASWIIAEEPDRDEIIAEEDLWYEIEYEFEMNKTSSGFIWGAEQSRYGEYYLWQIDTTGDQVELVMTRRKNEEILEEEVLPLKGYTIEEFTEKFHRMRIHVQKEKVDTYLDGRLISEKKAIIPTQVLGIGLWVTRGTDECWYDNIIIRDSKDQVVLRESFSDVQEHIFSPYYMKIRNGWGRADSGYIMQPGGEEPAPMFRKVFEIPANKEIDSARLYISALGIYDAFINGQDICEEYGAPGQSVYSQEVYYRTYDVSEYLQEGNNAIGFILGHGRYDRAHGRWGDELALCGQLTIQYEDGSKDIFGTDESWSVYSDGPIRSDDLFSGEYYDTNYEVDNWSTVECDEKGWQYARIYEEKSGLRKKAAPDNGVICIGTLEARHG